MGGYVRDKVTGSTDIAKGRNGVADTVNDSTGVYTLNPDALPHVLTYNGPGGAVDTITVTDTLGNQFRQTLTYTGSNVTGISAWVKL